MSSPCTCTRLLEENYTTEQVAQAIGRTPQHFCRIRHKFIANYKLKVIKIGRRFYYDRQSVDRMVDDIIKNGEEMAVAGHSGDARC